MADDLVSLAAWLRRQALQAEAVANAATEPYGARLSEQDAVRFARASEVVKEAADRQRHERPIAPPAAANQA